MSNSAFLTHNEVTTLNFKPNPTVTTLSNGGKCLWMNYYYPKSHMQNKLQVCTPDVWLPFGLSVFNPKAGSGGISRWSCDLSFYKMEENESLKSFYDFACKLDEYALKLALENCKEWFQQKKTKEVLEDKLKRLIRESNPPGKFAPTMKIHANPNQKGEFQFNIYTISGDRLPCSPNIEEARLVVPPKTKVRMLLEFSNIWFTNAGFGWSCKLKQLIIYPKNRIIDRPVLIDDILQAQAAEEKEDTMIISSA